MTTELKLPKTNGFTNWLILAFISAGIGFDSARAQAAPPEAEPPAEADAAVSDAGQPVVDPAANLDAWKAEFFETMVRFRRERWKRMMQGEMAEVKKIPGVSEDKFKALEAAAERVTSQCVGVWDKRLHEFFDKSVGKRAENTFTQLQLCIINLYWVQHRWIELSCVGPTQHPDWAKALSENLTAEQAVLFAQTQAPAKAELEKQIEELLLQASVSRQEQITTLIEKSVAELVQLLKLSPERTEVLKALGQKTIDSLMAEWRQRTSDYVQASEKQVQKHALSRQGSFARPNWDAFNVYRGEQLAIWNQALARVLSAEELGLIDKAKSEAEAKKQKAKSDKIAGKSKPKKVTPAIEQEARVAFGTWIRNEISILENSLELSPERVKTLEACVDSTVANMLKSAIEQNLDLRGDLLDAPAPSKKAGSKEPVDLRTLWTAELAQRLSPEENERAQARLARQVQSWGQMLVAELDAWLALSAAQRASLEPLLEAAVGKHFFGVGASSRARLALIASAVDPAQLTVLLNPAQSKQWQMFFSGADIQRRSRMASWTPEKYYLSYAQYLGGKPEKPADKLAKPNRERMPEATVESVISDFMAAQTAAHTKPVREEMERIYENVVQVADLSPEVSAQLRSAAGAAAQAAVFEQMTALEVRVRSSITATDPAKVHKELARERAFEVPPAAHPVTEQAIWMNALKSKLTPSQHAAYQKSLEDREAYLNAAIARLFMENFDRIYGLNVKQRSRLEPLFSALSKANKALIFQYFRSGLIDQLLICLMTEVPEQELKVTLSKDQWARLSQSDLFSRGAQTLKIFRQLDAAVLREFR